MYVKSTHEAKIVPTEFARLKNLSYTKTKSKTLKTLKFMTASMHIIMHLWQLEFVYNHTQKCFFLSARGVVFFTGIRYIDCAGFQFFWTILWQRHFFATACYKKEDETGFFRSMKKNMKWDRLKSCLKKKKMATRCVILVFFFHR